MSSSDFHESHFLTDSERLELSEAEPEARPVSYSGQDFDVEGLVRRVKNGDIVVPRFGHDDEEIQSAGFQRGFVWTRGQMDRFIESLLLGFPVPGVFFVRQESDKRYLVLDGQQRLLTLYDFYIGMHKGREFSLTNVSNEMRNLTYSTLSPELRRTLDNAFIQATIVETDGKPRSLEAVYQIFERLNSGGTQLTPHEIRVALYAGPLVELLNDLNQLPAWRELYGAKSVRVRDQELILRILALYGQADQYSRPLKTFLNSFAGKNRAASSQLLLRAAQLFTDACKVLVAGPGASALRTGTRQVNAARAEAVFVGLMRAIEHRTVSPETASTVVKLLASSDGFMNATAKSTADPDNVSRRLRIATEAFAEVP